MISSLGSKQHDCNDVQQKESSGAVNAVGANLQTSVEVSQTTDMLLEQILESSSNTSDCNNSDDIMLTAATIQSSPRSTSANSLSSIHLEEEETKEIESSTNRPHVGSYQQDKQDVYMKDADEKDKAKLDDDEWSKMSAESHILSNYSFDFSDEEESIADQKKIDASCQLSKRFDINLVVSSIERGEAVLDQVDGKDIVLLVGKTGTGKSTLIQGIAGRQLRETTHSCKSEYGDVDEKVVFETVQDALPGFEIGHEKTSMTSHISCYDPTQEGKKSNVVYVDCPGFEDTNGHEVDVATSVMLSK
eukprot:1447762-Ditylum_brightwellii.AAC.1